MCMFLKNIVGINYYFVYFIKLIFNQSNRVERNFIEIKLIIVKMEVNFNIVYYNFIKIIND